jgi:hypothetical protein
LCGFPPTAEPITLRLPFKQWRPDTVITDSDGNEMFVLLDQTQEMRSYEAIFGDLDGRRLCCVKRHLQAQFWKDGYYFCTYEPNYHGQRALSDRDIDNKRVYPYSYLQINPMKGRFYYRLFDNQEGLGPPKLKAEHPWMGYMVVAATPSVRTGRWAIKFKRVTNNVAAITVDQWKNRASVGPGVDLLAALCIAYVFDRFQCQPLITVIGRDPEDELEPIDDEHTIDSREQDELDVQSNKPYKDFDDEYDEDNYSKGKSRHGVDDSNVEDDENEHGITTNKAVNSADVDVPDFLDSNDENQNRKNIHHQQTSQNKTGNTGEKERDEFDEMPDLLDSNDVPSASTGSPNLTDNSSKRDFQPQVEKGKPSSDPYGTSWLKDRPTDPSIQANTTENQDPFSDSWIKDTKDDNPFATNELRSDERAPSFVSTLPEQDKTKPISDID